MGPDDTGRVVGYSETPLLSILRASLCGSGLQRQCTNPSDGVILPVCHHNCLGKQWKIGNI
jgi:hypothetical protein